MTRHGYMDSWDYDDVLDLGRYRGRVASAIRGKRGQRFLRELLAVLDAMPDQRLAAMTWDDYGLYGDGCVPCALGAYADAKEWPDRRDIDSADHELIAQRCDVAEVLIAEVEYVNDEWWRGATEAERWRGVREWVSERILGGNQ